MEKTPMLMGKINTPFKQPYHYTECGLDNVWLLNGFHVEHDEEHGELFSVEGMDDLHRAIGLYIACNDPQMSGKEMRFLRKQMGLTQKELADIVGTSRLTIQRYESGQTANENGPLDRLVRVLFAEHVKQQIPGVIERIKQLSAMEEDDHEHPLNFMYRNGHWESSRAA